MLNPKEIFSKLMTFFYALENLFDPDIPVVSRDVILESNSIICKDVPKQAMVYHFSRFQELCISSDNLLFLEQKIAGETLLHIRNCDESSPETC